ncbi:LPXTG cell wall anchor domain-containing protein [Actinoplanes xinjiangensis]|uniref:LPXTG cell wall anchor domain-containing protein n=1 Tax=Actinoplanes xinjiangensis TaxID=512350 RepID=UPI00342393B1
MLKKISAGALLALVLLIPAAPASAETETPVLNEACETVEPKIFTDIRELITIDLDTANVAQLRIVAYRILDAAKADSLPVLPGEIEKILRGTEEDLRAFLKKGVLSTWTHDLRISVGWTMTNAGTNVKAAANKALDGDSFEATLAYLNKGLYAARALDCASQPSPSPSVKPSVTPSATPSTTASATSSATASAGPAATGGEEDDGGEGGGLPVTGANTGVVAGAGGALLLLGGAGFLIGRRRRARFEA